MKQYVKKLDDRILTIQSFIDESTQSDEETEKKLNKHESEFTEIKTEKFLHSC